MIPTPAMSTSEHRDQRRTFFVEEDPTQTVPAWPTAHAVVHSPTTATLTINTHERTVTNPDVRSALLEIVCDELAVNFPQRFVRLTTEDPDGARGVLGIRADGAVIQIARELPDPPATRPARTLTTKMRGIPRRGAILITAISAAIIASAVAVAAILHSSPTPQPTAPAPTANSRASGPDLIGELQALHATRLEHAAARQRQQATAAANARATQAAKAKRLNAQRAQAARARARARAQQRARTSVRQPSRPQSTPPPVAPRVRARTPRSTRPAPTRPDPGQEFGP